MIYKDDTDLLQGDVYPVPKKAPMTDLEFSILYFEQGPDNNALKHAKRIIAAYREQKERADKAEAEVKAIEQSLEKLGDDIHSVLSAYSEDNEEDNDCSTSSPRLEGEWPS